MARYTAVIPSVRTLENTFAYMSDFSKAQEWDPGVVSAHRVGVGPIGVGTEFDLVVTFAGRRMTLRYRVEEFEENHRIVFESSSTVLRSVDSLTFVSRSGGSEMTYVADVRFTGVASLANPLLALGFHRVGDRARDSLRSVLGK
ncbi:MAG: SRPBCC family protein [Acidimicrobiales bacterium]